MSKDKTARKGPSPDERDAALRVLRAHLRLLMDEPPAPKDVAAARKHLKDIAEQGNVHVLRRMIASLIVMAEINT